MHGSLGGPLKVFLKKSQQEFQKQPMTNSCFLKESLKNFSEESEEKVLKKALEERHGGIPEASKGQPTKGLEKLLRKRIKEFLKKFLGKIFESIPNFFDKSFRD